VHANKTSSANAIRTQKGKSKYRICADTNNNPVYSSRIPYILNVAVFQLRPCYTTGSRDPIFRKSKGKGKATRMCIIMSFETEQEKQSKAQKGCCVNYLSIFLSTSISLHVISLFDPAYASSSSFVSSYTIQCGRPRPLQMGAGGIMQCQVVLNSRDFVSQYLYAVGRKSQCRIRG
jgi:hypothetical protein